VRVPDLGAAPDRGARSLMYHARRNAGRYVLHRIAGVIRKESCAAGSACDEIADFRATSPSFNAKPMCTGHAKVWAKRHRIELPA
jgi:hypothetical protein